MATPYLRQFGSAAIDNGWNPTPIRPSEKAPLLRDWQDIIATIPLWQQWVSAHYGDYGLGILTGHCVCIDIDTLDMAEAQFWTDYIRIVHGGLIRYGRRPKLAIILRCETIITKITSMAFVDPQGHKMQMEVLAKGQQFVAFGRHPDTGTDYEWVDDLSPATVRFADVIVITEAELRQLVAMWNERYIGFGWKRWSPAAGPGPNGSEYVRPDPPPNGHAGSANGFDTSTTGSADTAPPPGDDADELHDAAAAGEGRIGFSDEEIEAIVMAIPNRKPDPANPTAAGTTVLPSRDQWLKACFAIEIETGKSQFGRQLFFRWSAQYDSNRAEWEKVWNSIHDLVSRPVTFRFLLHLAKPFVKQKVEDFIKAFAACTSREGIDPICAKIRLLQFEDAELSMLLKALEQVYKRLGLPPPDIAVRRRMLRPEPKQPPLMDGWVYRTALGDCYNYKTDDAMGEKAFNKVFAMPNLTKPPIDFAVDQKWIETISYQQYRPDIDETFFTDDGKRWVNAFRPHTRPPTLARLSRRDQLAINIIEGHLRRLWDDRDVEILLSGISYAARTNQRLQYMTVLQGPTNTGKTRTLLALLNGAFGAANVDLINNRAVSGTFSGWAGRPVQALLYEEVYNPGERYQILEGMKEYIANPRVSVRAMRKDDFTVHNTINYFGLTNHWNALPLEADDSRYYVAVSKLRLSESAERHRRETILDERYADQLYKAQNDYAPALRWWMLNYAPHPDFIGHHRAPDSDGRRLMASMSNFSDDADLLREIVDAGSNHCVNYDIVIVSELRKLTQPKMRHGVALAILRACGFVPLEQDVKINSRLESVWSRHDQWPESPDLRRKFIRDRILGIPVPLWW